MGGSWRIGEKPERAKVGLRDLTGLLQGGGGEAKRQSATSMGRKEDGQEEKGRISDA